MTDVQLNTATELMRQIEKYEQALHCLTTDEIGRFYVGKGTQLHYLNTLFNHMQLKIIALLMDSILRDNIQQMTDQFKDL